MNLHFLQEVRLDLEVRRDQVSLVAHSVHPNHSFLVLQVIPFKFVQLINIHYYHILIFNNIYLFNSVCLIIACYTGWVRVVLVIKSKDFFNSFFLLDHFEELCTVRSVIHFSILVQMCYLYSDSHQMVTVFYRWWYLPSDPALLVDPFLLWLRGTRGRLAHPGDRMGRGVLEDPRTMEKISIKFTSTVFLIYRSSYLKYALWKWEIYQNTFYRNNILAIGLVLYFSP